jgi:hypothetical protein
VSRATTAAELVVRYSTAVDRLKRSHNPTRNDVDEFFVEVSNIVGELVTIVSDHVEQPFTKAHDKGGVSP